MGYHQLRLEKESSKVTAIITPLGVYRFLACPFGISTAPGKYQVRMAHEILQDYYLNGAEKNYTEDTIIYGRNVTNFAVSDFVKVSGIQCQTQTIQVLLWHGPY